MKEKIDSMKAAVAAAIGLLTGLWGWLGWLVVSWTVIVCLVCTVMFEAVPEVFIRMFGADGELYTHFAVGCLRIYLSLIIFTCVQKVCAIFLQSIGHAKAAAPLSVLRDVFLIVLSLIVPMFLGVTGIFWAAPVADILAIAITAVVMVRLWKQLGQSHESVTAELPSMAILPWESVQTVRKISNL